MKRIIGLRGVASALLAVSSVGLFSTTVIGRKLFVRGEFDLRHRHREQRAKD